MDPSQAVPLAQLLRDLSPETAHAARLGAARALGEIEASDVTVVRALLEAKERDPSYQVRQTAAMALRAAVCWRW